MPFGQASDTRGSAIAGPAKCGFERYVPFADIGNHPCPTGSRADRASARQRRRHPLAKRTNPASAEVGGRLCAYGVACGVPGRSRQSAVLGRSTRHRSGCCPALVTKMVAHTFSAKATQENSVGTRSTTMTEKGFPPLTPLALGSEDPLPTSTALTQTKPAKEKHPCISITPASTRMI